MHNEIGKHKLVGGLLNDWNGGGAAYFWSLLMGVPVGAQSVAASNGTPLVNSRTTPAFADVSPLGDATVMQLQGPNTVRLESRGLLQEDAATNLLSYSQQLGTAPWATGTSGAPLPAAPTVTQNTGDLLAPDGTQTATKVVFPACTGTGVSGLFQQVTGLTNGQVCTISVWARVLSGTGNLDMVYQDSGITHQNLALTTTWQRFQLFKNVAGTVVYLQLDTDATQTASGPVTVYLWGAQMEGKAWATSYFPTNTNNFVNSAGAAWGSTFTSGVPPMPVVSGLETAPDGTATAAKMVFGAVAAGQYALVQSNPNPSYTAGVTYNFSVWLRTQSGSATIYFMRNDGSTAQDTVTCNVTTTWTKFSGTTTPGAVQQGIAIGFECIGANPTGTTAGCTVLAWGFQLELGTQPSSTYITGAALTTTRALDVHQFANPLSGLNPTNWSIGALLTPASTWVNVYNANNGIALWFMVGVQTLANSVRGEVVGSGGVFAYDVWDNAAAVNSLNGGASVMTGSNPQSVVYFNKGGVQSSTPCGGSISGAGTGIITTQPATVTLNLGSSNFNFEGWYRSVFVDNK